jgi:exodeoxyribonuclease-5
MINDEYLEIIKELILPGAKVIFMGDNHQLPPVGQEADAKIFQYKLAELTERMRQGELSPIIPITDKVADNIENLKVERDAITERINNFNPETNKGVIFENNLNDALQLWKKDFELSPKSTKIITFNNENNNNAQSVKSLNKLARNILFGNNVEEFVEGDQIMGYDQFGEPEKPDLLNSVDYTVLETSKQSKSTYNVNAYSRAKGNRQIPITVSGYNLTIQNNINGSISTIFALDSESKDIVRNKVTELYNGVNKDSQMAMVLSMYFPKLEHGYAITSHKSQGSTYRNVYVMEDNILGNVNGSNKTVNQSLYVAVSRPSDKLVIDSRKNLKTKNDKVEPSPDAKSIDELFVKPCDGGASM